MTTDIAIPDEHELTQAPANLFGTQNPAEVVARSSEIAGALADVLRSKNLAKSISGRQFVLVEGWTLLGTMLGVFPVVEWTRPVEDGWEARVEARTLGGQVVGAAEAECLRSEKNWKNRDDYALRSMAQTRAVSKALRGPLGFIVTLAGYEATPAEEIPPESGSENSVAETDSALTDRGNHSQMSLPDPEITFGKNKGKRVSETPAEWREWMVANYTATDEQGDAIMAAIKDSLIPF